MSTNTVVTERRGPVLVVTLNRPPVNALGHELLEAIGGVFRSASLDPAIRAIVLGGGARAFSAGADIKELAALATEPDARAWIERGQSVMDQIASASRPVIAAIEGACFGGGLELALACHLRIAAEGAQLGLPEVKLGVLPGFGGTQRLPRILPSPLALEAILTGDPIPLQAASASGLVNRVVPRGEALAASLELAETIASRSATAIASILRVVRHGLDGPRRDGLQAELDAVARAIVSADGQEGTAAFVEKRPARFLAPAE